jgi:membrane protein
MEKGQPGDLSSGIKVRIADRARPFLTLLRSAWVEYERDHARYLAVAMVYYALVSLVPMLLLLVAALGLLLRFSEWAAIAEQQVLDLVEDRFGAQVGTTISQLLDRLQQESVVASIVSLAGLLLTASVLFKQLRLAFRAIWRYQPPLVSGSARVVARTTFLNQVMAFAIMGTAGVLLLAGLGLFAALQWLSGLFGNTPLLADATGWLLALTSPLIMVTLTFALLFKFLPPVQLPWRHVWLASVLCAAAWIVTAEILALYGANFGGGSASGAIGGLLAIMLWMNTVSQVLFYGAELCKVVAARDGHDTADRVAHLPDRVASAPPVERRVNEPRRRAG